MPRRDGRGPAGLGPLTGRGLGPCRPGNKLKYGAGIGLGLLIGLAVGKNLKTLFKTK